jgi:hypothetical protein
MARPCSDCGRPVRKAEHAQCYVCRGRPGTDERGYGADHQAARRRALATMQDGDLCCLCRRPMYRRQPLDLDHTPRRDGYRGLAHARCNRRDGAIRGNKARAKVKHDKKPPRWRSRAW